MARLTKKVDNKYQVDNINEAIHRLGILEDICCDLQDAQEKLSKQLEKLRMEDKTKSVAFRELMTQKLTNTSILNLLKINGLLDL